MVQPRAFLSYTRIDDEFFGGSITALRHYLELGVRVTTGDQSFSIFQDVDGIELGQQWQKRLDEAIATTSFLIPVLTPSFFRSDACRDELQKFLHFEKSARREDLILPIYFVTVPSLEKNDPNAVDLLAADINKRQRFDWRAQADLPLSDLQVKRAARQLCDKIGVALQHLPDGKASYFQNNQNLPPNRDLEIAAKAVTSNFQNTRSEKNRRRILWVDDNPRNNILERQSLTEYGVEFELAKSTKEALDILRNSNFDAIISDMGRPPDMRAGYTLLNELREKGNKTPYFIYAGSRAPEHVAEAKQRGAQGSTNRAAELIDMILQKIG